MEAISSKELKDTEPAKAHYETTYSEEIQIEFNLALYRNKRDATFGRYWRYIFEYAPNYQLIKEKNVTTVLGKLYFF